MDRIDESVPEPPTETTIPMTADATTLGVLTLVLQQLGATERRITTKIDENSDAARRRWKAHDEEHSELLALVRDNQKRISALEQDEHDEDLLWSARIGPVRGVVVFVMHEWRTILIILLFLATWLGFAEFEGGGLF